ncbi:MAG TPA: hypothetical protein VM537_16410, partial [Anaerolineae bacterium]|nr:hypothetical protein [Anaerolineae bacterium]
PVHERTYCNADTNQDQPFNPGADRDGHAYRDGNSTVDTCLCAASSPFMRGRFAAASLPLLS